MMDRVADDIERSQSLTSTTIPRGSSTASKTIAALHKIGEGAHHGSGWLAPLAIASEAREFIPHTLQNPLTIAAGVAGVGTKMAYSRFAKKGTEKAVEAYHDAIMNPRQGD